HLIAKANLGAVPPAFLRYKVSGSIDVASFLDVGAVTVLCISEALASAGADLSSFDTILDFGCGCGRTLLWLQKEVAPGQRLFGTDTDAEAIRWCQRRLIFGDFATNGSSPPLQYADASFDFIYAISVFTHLDAARQDDWLGELQRVARPGGFVLLT